MPEPYPLLLERQMSRRLWGGSRLADYLNIPEQREGEPFAEAWQVYEDNVVTNGPWQGRTLGEVAREEGAALLGTATVARFGREVPLLAKFIDAAQPLSIQVHPDDDYVAANPQAGGRFGKAEAWYILAADPGATIIWGFSEQMSRQQVREAVNQETLEQHLNIVPVAAGDVIYNPPGTVHAVGAGIFLFEIQQSSDITYRLYDYGRRDARGRTRELHLEQALQVADLAKGRFAPVEPLQLDDSRRLLVETEYFVMEEMRAGAPLRLTTSASSLELLTVTDGNVQLDHSTGMVELGRGRSAVLPAALGEYRLSGDGTALRCCVPVN